MMTNITNNEISEPDPAWDYYVIWHKLFKTKKHLEKLMQEVAVIEYASTEVDNGINNDLEKMIGILSDALVSEPPDEAT